jgi:MFS family permease
LRANFKGLGPLAKRPFALFFVASLTSLIGTGLVSVAVTFAIFQLGGGPAQVSAALAAETLPLVLFLLAGGVVADRCPRRSVMIGADLLRLAAEFVLAVLIIGGYATLREIISLSAIIGCGTAFFLPAHRAFVSQVVDTQQLPAANALMSIGGSLAGILGPFFGGILVNITGPGWAIGADAVTYAISASCLLLIRGVMTVSVPSVGFYVLLVDGWKEFRGRRWLWLLVTQAALLHLLVQGPVFILGALHFRHIAHGAAIWGSLLAAIGLGAMFGGIIALRLDPRYPLRTAVLTLVLSALPPAAIAINAPFFADIAAFFLDGVSIALYTVLWNTTLQRKIPQDVLSRIFAYDTFGSVCLMPFGFLLAAPMADGFGGSGALWVAAAFAAISSTLLLLSSEIRNLPRAGVE